METQPCSPPDVTEPRILNDDAILLILSYLPLKDKVTLHQEIPSWRHMTAYLLAKQRIVTCGTCEDPLDLEPAVTDMNSIPKHWFANENLSQWKLILELCSNLTELYLFNLREIQIPQITIIVKGILRKCKNLKSLAVDYEPIYIDQLNNRVVKFCRNNFQLEYLRYSFLEFAEINEIIDNNPLLHGIWEPRFSANFIRGQVQFKDMEIDDLFQEGTLTGFCLHLQTRNSHYNRLCLNGITLDKLTLTDYTNYTFSEICHLFTGIRFLSLQVDEELMDIRLLQSLTRLKELKLSGKGAFMVDDPPEYQLDEQIEVNTEDDVDEVPDYCINSSRVIENIGFLLPHLMELEKLELYDVFISDRTLKTINEFCPNLRYLDIEYAEMDRPIITDKSLKSICQLENLIYFNCNIPEVNDIKWDTILVVESNRRTLLD